MNALDGSDVRLRSCFFFSKESETNIVSGRVLVGETFESVSQGKVRRSCLQRRD